MTRAFTKVLIANRGEIACRLIAAARSLGLATVAVYSEADTGARHVRLADEAVAIGPGPAAESYLKIDRLLAVAEQTGAGAVHPGYGFLSERAVFARAVRAAGLVWIGPDPDVIELLGNKIAAKRVAEQADVPTLPWAILGGDNGQAWTPAELRAAAARIGFPLLLKAAAGGGGRGMRVVAAEAELEDKAASAAREAEGAFGSGELFLEVYNPSPRHVEVQIVGDNRGRVVALGERECSVQRRHQKVIEEAPAPRLADATRRALWQAAAELGRAVGYTNAGTVEFLVDERENFYFLEVNTRLQVEHPVTELVWGVDLPALQYRVALGEPLPKDIEAGERPPRGHAIEARLYAEDPGRGFMPSPGRLARLHTPHLPHVRLDAGYEAGDEIPIFYDAMIAKLIAWGEDREQARLALLDALARTQVAGIAWNGPFLQDVLRHERFVRGEVDTRFLDEAFAGWQGESRVEAPDPSSLLSSSVRLASSPTADSPTALSPGGRGPSEEGTRAGPPSPWLAFAGGSVPQAGGPAAARRRSAAHADVQEVVFEGPLLAEYPGKVLKVLVAPGDQVEQDQVVVVCESMKMEFAYAAPRAARVRSVGVEEGQVIPGGTLLVAWEDGET